MSAKKSEVLALIPARGGSKSIPHKNTQDFLGFPLIAFSIAAARQATEVTRVIVSTDDEEIAAIAREFGAETPFMRPSEFAQDDTPDLPVFKHALSWLQENEGYSPDYLVQLRPTSPLRKAGLIDRAVAVLQENTEADSVRGLVEASQNPHKMWRLDDKGQMQALLSIEGVDEVYNAPRQSLPVIYWQSGHIDVIRRETIEEKGSMSGDLIWPVHIESKYTVDIDTQSDLRAAEHLAMSGDVEIVWPGKQPRALPEKVKLLVLDFDGVITDDRVWVDAQGNEQVAAHRGDGMGIALLKKKNIEVFVLSSETNPVVSARCKKLGIEAKQGLEDKAQALKALLKERNISAEETVYLGNDVNDLACFPLVACAVAVNDTHPSVKRKADISLSKKGGHGAVRELCDLILESHS